ncbi:MAG: nucleoside-triphosphatase [Terriglobia bacterium]
MNLLLAGKPAVGKTTLVEQVVARLQAAGWRLSGFLTREVRDPRGARTGFKIITLDGEEGELARIGLPGPVRVGRYGVNLADLERLTLPRIRVRDADLLVIDEIGKMECASGRFRRGVEDALDAPTPVLATLGTGPAYFLAALRARPDVELLQVTEKTRAQRLDEVLARLGRGRRG